MSTPQPPQRSTGGGTALRRSARPIGIGLAALLLAAANPPGAVVHGAVVHGAVVHGAVSFEHRAVRAPSTRAAQDGAWERAAALESTDPNGAARAFLEALGAEVGELSGPNQALGYRLGAALAESGDLADAADFQLVLHERVGADWSAINATITLIRAGRLAEAEGLLADHEPIAIAAGDVANYRGLVAMARADVTAARHHFSRALVQGSRDAGLSLARMDLLAGRAAAARAGFRPSVDDPSPHAWALRGWALTLLP